ncbi:hypothetical protein AgCh_036660 [Apium graveolens]
MYTITMIHDDRGNNDGDNIKMPLLVSLVSSVSGETRPSHPHRFKAGALNALGVECLAKGAAEKGGRKGRSKWLRDEGDTDWEAKMGGDNDSPGFTGENSGGQNKEITVRRVSRDSGPIMVSDHVYAENQISPYVLARVIQNSTNYIGPEEEESSGLNIEDRKRRGSGPASNTAMNTNDSSKIIKGTHTEAVLSETDCSASSHHVLAKLAKQASQSQ